MKSLIPYRKKVNFRFTYDTPLLFSLGSLRTCKENIFFFSKILSFDRGVGI